MQLVPRTNAISRVSPNARNQLHLSAIPCFAILYYIVYTVSRCLCVVGRHILPAPHADVFWLGKMQITSRSKSQSAFPPRLVFDTPPCKQAEQCKHFTVSQAQSQCARKVNFSASIAARTPTRSPFPSPFSLPLLLCHCLMNSPLVPNLCGLTPPGMTINLPHTQGMPLCGDSLCVCCV